MASLPEYPLGLGLIDYFTFIYSMVWFLAAYLFLKKGDNVVK
jgi:hypothetical protein